jgi:hypothetical protein
MKAPYGRKHAQSFIRSTLWGDASHALGRPDVHDGLSVSMESTARFGETLRLWHTLWGDTSHALGRHIARFGETHRTLWGDKNYCNSWKNNGIFLQDSLTF